MSRAARYVCIVMLLGGGRVLARPWIPVGLTGHDVLSVYAQFYDQAYAASTNGLYFTSCRGDTWDTLYVYGPHPETRAAVRASGEEVFLAWGWGSRSDGLWKSTDGGATWEASRYLLHAGVLEWGWVGQSVLLLGSDTLDQGVWRSTDDGASWAEADSGLPDSRVRDFVFRHDSVICGTRGNGVYVSFDAGCSWHPAGLEGCDVRAVSWAWRWVPELWVLAGVAAPAESAGIWASSDLGASWTRELVVAGATDLERDYYATFRGDSGVYFGVHGSWGPEFEGLTTRLVNCVAGEGFIWAGTADGVFWYDHTPGVEESGLGPARPRSRVSCSAGVLTLFGEQDGALCNATGRRVLRLTPGQNDVRRLAPGAYFVVTGQGRDKVVLAR
jgi:hypothetical protein